MLAKYNPDDVLAFLIVLGCLLMIAFNRGGSVPTGVLQSVVAYAFGHKVGRRSAA